MSNDKIRNLTSLTSDVLLAINGTTPLAPKRDKALFRTGMLNKQTDRFLVNSGLDIGDVKPGKINVRSLLDETETVNKKGVPTQVYRDVKSKNTFEDLLRNGQSISGTTTRPVYFYFPLMVIGRAPEIRALIAYYRGISKVGLQANARDQQKLDFDVRIGELADRYNEGQIDYIAPYLVVGGGINDQGRVGDVTNLVNLLFPRLEKSEKEQLRDPTLTLLESYVDPSITRFVPLSQLSAEQRASLESFNGKGRQRLSTIEALEEAIGYAARFVDDDKNFPVVDIRLGKDYGIKISHESVKTNEINNTDGEVVAHTKKKAKGGAAAERSYVFSISLKTRNSYFALDSDGSATNDGTPYILNFTLKFRQNILDNPDQLAAAAGMVAQFATTRENYNGQVTVSMDNLASRALELYAAKRTDGNRNMIPEQEAPRPIPEAAIEAALESVNRKSMPPRPQPEQEEFRQGDFSIDRAREEGGQEGSESLYPGDVAEGVPANVPPSASAEVPFPF